MEIVKENKIKQIIQAEIKKEDKEYGAFLAVIKKFSEKILEQEIEGSIDKVEVSCGGWRNSLEIKISTIKEDKLKLLTDKTIDM